MGRRAAEKKKKKGKPGSSEFGKNTSSP